MTEHFTTDLSLTAAECARRLGLTVRALRLYEHYGLISPARTQKGWRIYGPAEIARLSEVLALKRLGLSLAKIADLLTGRPADLARMLALQHEALTTLRTRVQHGLELIGLLQSKIADGQSVSIDELITLARETTLTDNSADAMAWRRYEQMRPRTEAEIDRSLYERYAGHYRLEDGPYYVVTHRDGRLFVRVIGQSDIEIFPESETGFFMRDLPVQVTFEPDVAGQVDSLVHHQNGLETKAGRVDASLVETAEAALKARIRDQAPVPDSEVILRRVIAEHQRGEPDYERLSPVLAALARAQIGKIRADLERAGPLRDIAFRGVNPAGWDVYEVQFQSARIEWSFILNADDKISGMLLRPLL